VTSTLHEIQATICVTQTAVLSDYWKQAWCRAAARALTCCPVGLDVGPVSKEAGSRSDLKVCTVCCVWFRCCTDILCAVRCELCSNCNFHLNDFCKGCNKPAGLCVRFEAGM